MPKYWTKAAFALVLSATNAGADQVLERIEVKTTPEKAWAAIGDFCGIKDWHPAVASCDLQGEGKTQLRTIILKDGAKIVEKEVNWNDLGRAYSYKAIESPLPVETYAATLKVLPIDKKTVDLLWTKLLQADRAERRSKESGLRPVSGRPEEP